MIVARLVSDELAYSAALLAGKTDLHCWPSQTKSVALLTTCYRQRTEKAVGLFQAVNGYQTRISVVRRQTWSTIRVTMEDVMFAKHARLGRGFAVSFAAFYFRYWTFFADAADSDVVHIKRLDLTRTQMSMSNVNGATHREAWKDFLQRVPPTSYVGIQNFMMACIAKGRNFDRSDTLQDGAGRGSPVTCSITMTDINNSLTFDYVPTGNVCSEESASVQRNKLYMATQLKTARNIMKIQQDTSKATKSKKHCSSLMH